MTVSQGARGLPASTIFSDISALARRHGAIDLGQGFPDADGPPEMLAAAQAAIAAGHNQYAPGWGVPELRAAISGYRADLYGTVYDPAAEVLVTVGATEAITAAIIALTEPGDMVVGFDPGYDSYAAAATIAGARFRTVPLSYSISERRWSFSAPQLEAALSNARVLVLNTPHNPTGMVLTEAELTVIVRLAEKHDVIIVSDEVYEHLHYDATTHISPAAIPGGRERTIAVSAASKLLSATGWKIGWALGPRHHLAAIRSVTQYLSFSTATPLQYAVAAALTSSRPWISELRASLQDRRDLLVSGLEAAGWRPRATEGSYFVTATAPERVSGSLVGREFCEQVIRSAGVATIPLSAFYTDPLHLASHPADLRFAVVKAPSAIIAGTQRLRDWNPAA